jgi:hypothetical protein
MRLVVGCRRGRGNARPRRRARLAHRSSGATSRRSRAVEPLRHSRPRRAGTAHRSGQLVRREPCATHHLGLLVESSGIVLRPVGSYRRRRARGARVQSHIASVVSIPRRRVRKASSERRFTGRGSVVRSSPLYECARRSPDLPLPRARGPTHRRGQAWRDPAPVPSSPRRARSNRCA